MILIQSFLERGRNKTDYDEIRIVPVGTVITEDMLTFKRPGTGISPQDMDKVVGRVAVTDIAEDTIIKAGMIGE